MSKVASPPRTAFIAASAPTSLTVIFEELAERGITPVTAYDSPPSTSTILSSIVAAIQHADLIVAVIAADRSANVFLELGIALALQKRVLVVASPRQKDLPSDLAGQHCIWADSDNREAIGFALDQIVASKGRKQARRVECEPKARPLGAIVDKHLAVLRSTDINERQVESIVEELIRESGATSVTRNPNPGVGADLAVWSDDFQNLVGNPLLVEVRCYLRDTARMHQVLEQVDHLRHKGGTAWALLVHHSTVGSLPRVGGVLAISFEDLLERLRTESFAEIVRSLRNHHVHRGGGK